MPATQTGQLAESAAPRELVLVWAQAHNRVIGRAGTMPWHVPEDLAHFKAVTLGAPVVMGRRTWESLPEAVRPLPGRRNIVVSRNTAYAVPGAELLPSLDDALGALVEQPRVCVMGGGELYRSAMPLATELIVTRIDLEVPDADTFAPEIDASWRLESETEPQISRSGLSYRFQCYKRQIA